MAGVDEVVKHGYSTRSNGRHRWKRRGFLTNWTVTQTDRFKAAVSQRDIADWIYFWCTADFTLFRPSWFRKPPFQDPEDFAKLADDLRRQDPTPLLLILGDEDWRTPPQPAARSFRALKAERATLRWSLPDENHDSHVRGYRGTGSTAPAHRRLVRQVFVGR